MKKRSILTSLVLLCSICFFQISCSKDSDDDTSYNQELKDYTPGEIPGLGEKEGELTGIKYTLPEGISQEGEITGFSGYYGNFSKVNTETQQGFKASISKKRAALKADLANNTADFTRGSGEYVRLALNLKNSTSSEKRFEIPAGLIIKSRSGHYQNGVLLKKVTITIPANSTKLLDLHMYCGNASKSSSSSSEQYDFAVVTNSRIIHDLINKLKNKKINIEQYNVQEDYSSDYWDIVDELQDILWALTDSSQGLSESELKYLEELPND